MKTDNQAGWVVVPREPVAEMATAARKRFEQDERDDVTDWFAVVADAKLRYACTDKAERMAAAAIAKALGDA